MANVFYDSAPFRRIFVKFHLKPAFIIATITSLLVNLLVLMFLSILLINN
ncbi:MAG: hypothetical protein ACJAYK_000207 [Crocinitomicaceae bacterium]|jgi:hypothetical protein